MDFEERGYFRDAKKTRFRARVRKAVPDGESGSHVWLDKTYFYPLSGGQPADRGTLGGLPVVEVAEDEDGVRHTLRGSLPEGAEVEGLVDPGLRLDHMQQHSGQHLLSRVFLEKYGLSTVGFHLGEITSTIDLDGENLTEEKIREVEEEVNRLVLANTPISVRIVGREEYDRLREEDASGGKGLRSRLPQEVEKVRLVEIEGIDSSTCCGTHCSFTGEIGTVKVLGTEKVKNGTRVEFVCGQRAYRDYRQKNEALDRLAGMFTTDWRQLPPLVEKLSREVRSLRKEIDSLHRELAKHQAEELARPTGKIGGYGLVRKVFPDAESNVLREMVSRIRDRGDLVVLIGYRRPAPGLIFACSTGIELHMGELLKSAAAVMGARGGGGADFAQGGGGEEARVDAALDEAERLAREMLE
ncbi:MAG: hypothetical protein JXB45_10800 [Candidatus Krumholzibacteriota bacterium]|nr:hypothetical protein [Candidatus Krumholzibacteriota bacterium]